MNLLDRLKALDYFVDNEYLHKYVELIELNCDRKFESCKTNRHHIIPRHYYRKRNIPIDNSKHNVVVLLYQDHALAHLYLAGCTQGKERYENLYAVFIMSGQKYFPHIEDYTKLLIEYPTIYQEAIAAAPNHRKGVKCSEITKQRMSAASKGKPSHNKNKIWVHNETKDCMVTEDEFELLKSKGYERGRLYRHSIETKNAIGMKSTGKRSAEFCQKMHDIALQQPKPTAERRHQHSEYMKQYYKEHTNPFSGKKHTEESKQKMRETLKHRVTIHKDNKTIRIMDYNLEKYLNDGWELKKANPNAAARIWINNGIISKCIYENKYDKYKEAGFVIGKI